jgi:hypothetical protein
MGASTGIAATVRILRDRATNRKEFEPPSWRFASSGASNNATACSREPGRQFAGVNDYW